MKLIVGLGNPWDKYMKTKHNIGFVAIDYFLQGIADFSYDNKIGGEVASSLFEWEKVYFLKPMEFMNKSGDAVQRLAHFYKIEAKDILVLHDEIDLAIGVVKYKFWGGLAWHNGLKDITNKLWTQDFARIRIWVDRPLQKEQVADWVLSNFKTNDREKIMDQFPAIEELIRKFIEG